MLASRPYAAHTPDIPPSMSVTGGLFSGVIVPILVGNVVSRVTIRRAAAAPALTRAPLFCSTPALPSAASPVPNELAVGLPHGLPLPLAQQ